MGNVCYSLVMEILRGKALARFGRALRQQGVLPLLTRRASVSFNRLFRSRLCVWVWRPDLPLVAASDVVRIERYSAANQLPPPTQQELVNGDNPGFTARMHEEFSEGGVLWVGYVEERVAGYQWSRRGQFVENWHFELNERDVLIYSTVTFHDFRGLGVGPAIMSNICRQEVASSGRAWADCMVWNKPAIRFIQKTGFEKAAERKPLRDHPD